MSDAPPKCVSSTTLVIQPGGGSSNTVVTTSANMATSSTFSKASSTQVSKTGTSSTTKSTKTSTSTSKTVKTSSMTTKSSSMKSSSTSSRAISINSNTSNFSDFFGKERGIDTDAELKKLMGEADTEIQSIRSKFFNLQPLAPISSGTGSDVIKLDSTSMSNYIDKSHDDRLKFNFDVTEFESESISVKSDGNKIEVHAKKRVKKGDDESSEEYSRTYELPTAGTLDPDKVTSSFYKDGVLTIELPVNEATKA